MRHIFVTILHRAAPTYFMLWSETSEAWTLTAILCEFRSFFVVFYIYIYIYTQGVPGGMCQTSGGCSLC